jgi:hypothetical protein
MEGMIGRISPKIYWKNGRVELEEKAYSRRETHNIHKFERHKYRTDMYKLRLSRNETWQFWHG